MVQMTPQYFAMPPLILEVKIWFLPCIEVKRFEENVFFYTALEVVCQDLLCQGMLWNRSFSIFCKIFHTISVPSFKSSIP